MRAVLGDRKTGKSYYARHTVLARELGPGNLGIMWTPNSAASDPCDIVDSRGRPLMVDTTAEEVINSKSLPAAICLRDEDPETVCMIAVAAARKFRVTLLLDEAHQVFPENFSPKSQASALFHRGRHLGVNLIAVSQWPAHLSKKLFRASDTVYWFRLNAFEDLKWLETRFGETAAREVNSLARYHHIEVHGDDLPDTWKRWTLDGDSDGESPEQGSHIVAPDESESNAESDRNGRDGSVDMDVATHRSVGASPSPVTKQLPE